MINKGMLQRIKAVRRKFSSPIRIRRRKEWEDEAISIIEGGLGRLDRAAVREVIELLDSDVQDGKITKRRFGSMLVGSNKMQILENPPALLNKLFIQIYRDENIAAADDLIETIKGVGQGFVSCLLYLKKRSRYNIMSSRLIEGINIIFRVSIPKVGPFQERYKTFNSLVNELRKECRLEPQEVDLVLWAIARGY